MVPEVDPIWPHSNSLTGLAEALKSSSSVMDPPAEITLTSDIVSGIVSAVDRPYPYQIFNLGKGDGTSLKDFINIVQEQVGKKANIKVMPDQPGDVPYTCADVSKAQRLLSYKAKVPFEEGISRTAKWYKSAYSKKQIEICPERQANGLGRSPSMVHIQQMKAN
eukprot:581637_1